MASSDERRDRGRIQTEALRSSEGRVIDLSQTGARLATRGRWREGERRTITVRGRDIMMTLDATCVWARREGWMRRVIGICFENTTPEQARMLGDLARRHAARMWAPPAKDRDAA